MIRPSVFPVSLLSILYRVEWKNVHANEILLVYHSQTRPRTSLFCRLQAFGLAIVWPSTPRVSSHRSPSFILSRRNRSSCSSNIIDDSDAYLDT
jgi:hypothetical protein